MPIEKEMIGGCCVCGDERGFCENPIVYCDGERCNVAVHQACYGIQKVPPGDWFCQPCELKAKSVKCELCPANYGALKLTDTKKWAHVVCALYIPELRFGNISTMEPIEMNSLKEERLNLSCMLCESAGRDTKARIGACITCNHSSCTCSFHVTCAQLEGLLCEVVSPQSSFSIKYQIFCPNHIQKRKRSSTYKIRHLPAYKPPKINDQYKPKASKNTFINFNNCKTPSLNLSSTSSSSSSPSSPESTPKKSSNSSIKKKSSSPTRNPLSNGTELKSDSSKLVNKPPLATFKQQSFSSSTSSLISTPTTSNNLNVPRKRNHSSSSSSSSNQSNSDSSASESDYDSESDSSSSTSVSKSSASESVSDSERNTSGEKSSPVKTPDKLSQPSSQQKTVKKCSPKDSSLLVKDSEASYKSSGSKILDSKLAPVKKDSDKSILKPSQADKRRQESKPGDFLASRSSNQLVNRLNDQAKYQNDRKTKKSILSESSSDQSDNDSDDEDFGVKMRNKNRLTAGRKSSSSSVRKPEKEGNGDIKKVKKDLLDSSKKLPKPLAKPPVKRTMEHFNTASGLDFNGPSSAEFKKLSNGIDESGKLHIPTRSTNNGLLMLSEPIPRGTIAFDPLKVPQYGINVHPFIHSSPPPSERPPTPKSFEEYLEYHWIHSSHYLMELEENRDIAQLMKKFNLLTQCNQKLESSVRQKKEQLQHFQLLSHSLKTELNSVLGAKEKLDSAISSEPELGAAKKSIERPAPKPNSSLTNLLAATQIPLESKMSLDFATSSQSSSNLASFLNSTVKTFDKMTPTVTNTSQSFLQQTLARQNHPPPTSTATFRSQSSTNSNSLLSFASNNTGLLNTVDTSTLKLTSLSNGSYNNHHVPSFTQN